MSAEYKNDGYLHNRQVERAFKPITVVRCDDRPAWIYFFAKSLIAFLIRLAQRLTYLQGDSESLA